jgi:hypothetical protein
LQDNYDMGDAGRMLLEQLQRMDAEMYPDLFPDVPAEDDNNNYPAAHCDDGFYITSTPSTPIVHREADVLEASPEFKVFKQLAGNDDDGEPGSTAALKSSTGLVATKPQSRASSSCHCSS